MSHITASHLCAYLRCPHRIYRDAFDDPTDKDPPNEFVQMLWEQGTQYEAEIIESLAGEKALLNLSVVPVVDRAAKTLEALAAGVPLIYHGRLQTEKLLGEPDLLERLPSGEYLPVDIKSGMGLEGQDEDGEGSYKKGYAVQLALYTDALRQLGHATHCRGAIWDSRGQVVDYDLLAPRGKRTEECWWNFYEDTLLAVRMLRDGRQKTPPALGSTCALCEWKRTCKEQCVQGRCLSLIPELGRAKKEALTGFFTTIDDLAAAELSELIDDKGKTGIPGIGPATLEKFIRRARLLATDNALPLILKPLAWPSRPVELFFDIEAASPFAGLDKALLRSTKQTSPALPQSTPKQQSAKPQTNDTVIPRHHDTTVSTMPPRNRDTTVSHVENDIFDVVRKAVKQIGKEAATHRFTLDEKSLLADIEYTYKRQGIRTSENEITRIAINYFIEDYRKNGESSLLVKILHRLNS